MNIPNNTITDVFIKHAPMDWSVERFTRIFSFYGDVRKITDVDIRTGEISRSNNYAGKISGTRKICMRINRPIPSSLCVENERIEVYHKGQLRTCYKCGGGHIRKDCKVTDPDNFTNRFSLDQFPELGTATMVSSAITNMEEVDPSKESEEVPLGEANLPEGEKNGEEMQPEESNPLNKETPPEAPKTGDDPMENPEKVPEANPHDMAISDSDETKVSQRKSPEVKATFTEIHTKVDSEAGNKVSESTSGKVNEASKDKITVQVQGKETKDIIIDPLDIHNISSQAQAIEGKMDTAPTPTQCEPSVEKGKNLAVRMVLCGLNHLV